MPSLVMPIGIGVINVAGNSAARVCRMLVPALGHVSRRSGAAPMFPWTSE